MTLLERFFRPAIAFLFAATGLAMPAGADETLYATGGNGLYRIDPATGAATSIWAFPGVAIYAGGLAYDAATDTLYATGNISTSSGITRLFSINRHTGVLTAFPGMSPTVNLMSGGLAIHPTTGVMYATGTDGIHQSSVLYTIDKTTGAETTVGVNGPNCCGNGTFGFSMYGLGFRSDGTLFANGYSSATTSSHLFTVNIVSGLATDIGSHGVAVGRELAYSGLAFGETGTLYSMGSLSASTSGLYSVNPTSGLATVIGNLVLPLGVDGGLSFVPIGAPTLYCTAKTNSQGCVPSIGFTGMPSATSATPFTVAAANVLNQKPGLLLYSYAQQIAPFQGGFLCLSSPLRRLAVGSAGGSLPPTIDCTGSYSLDFNQRIQSGLDPQLVPGQEVDAQYWMRDPAGLSGSGLTDAVSFQIRA